MIYTLSVKNSTIFDSISLYIYIGLRLLKLSTLMNIHKIYEYDYVNIMKRHIYQKILLVNPALGNEILSYLLNIILYIIS